MRRVGFTLPSCAFHLPLPLAATFNSRQAFAHSEKQPLKCRLSPCASILLSTAFSLTLQAFPVPSVHAAAPSTQPSTQSTQSAPSTEDLKTQSQKNTRTSGKTAQLFALARRQQAAGDLEAAFSSYNEIITAQPTFAPAYSNRGNIHAAKKNYNAALQDYSTAISLAPVDREVWLVYTNRGCTHLALDDIPSALDDLNKAAELQPNNQIVLSNRAGVWERLQKWDSAIRDYQKAFNSNDVQPFWQRYALVMFQRNRPVEALAILKRVEGRFDVSDVHAALAVVLFDRGDIVAAESEWGLVDRPKLFESRKFLETERYWPPRAIEAMQRFRPRTE